MMTKQPAVTPSKNGNAFFNPNRLALSKDIILFGPGVKLVTSA